MLNSTSFLHKYAVPKVVSRANVEETVFHQYALQKLPSSNKEVSPTK